MKLFPGADDDLLDRLQQVLNVAQTPIEKLPVKSEAKALYDILQVSSRIIGHESCDCWHDAYVLLWIDGKLYRLLVEFKPCFPIKIGGLCWLSVVVSDLLEVRIHSKDQARMLGPNFHGLPHAEWPEAVSILVSTGEQLLVFNRATLALSFGGLAALVNNVLRLYDPRKPKPDVVWLTTREPNNYLVVDAGGVEVYLLVFGAGGSFVEARVYKPARVAGVGYIQSLGGVRRRIKTLKDTATDAGLEHPVLLGRFVKHVVLSEDPSSAVFIGTIDPTLDAKIEAFFARSDTNSPYLASNEFWTSALSEAVSKAWAAATPTLAQKKILKDQKKAIETINGTAPGMVGADARATEVAVSSLKATYEYYAAHPFDAGAVRASGHGATHVISYAFAHHCSWVAGKDVLAAEAGTFVFRTPDGVPIHAGDDAWRAGQRPKVKLIAYETDDSGSVEAQVLKEADALAVVEAMADDEAKEETKEEPEEEEESDAPPAQRARTTS